MANKNPSPKTRFKRGQIANPSGAGAHRKELKIIRKLTAEKIAEIGALILEESPESLQRIVKDKGTDTLTAMIAAVALKAVRNGDPQALDCILNRIVGRVAQQTLVKARKESPYAHLTTDQLIALRDQRQKELQVPIPTSQSS